MAFTPEGCKKLYEQLAETLNELSHHAESIVLHPGLPQSISGFCYSVTWNVLLSKWEVSEE